MSRGIGNRLKSLRLKNNLSQTEMGNKVGTSFNTIQRLEKGETGISYNVLANISKEFELSLDYIIFGGDSDYSQVEMVKSIAFKLNHSKQLDDEERQLIDKLFFYRMENIHNKRLLSDLSQELSNLSEGQLVNIIKLFNQLSKLDKNELSALLRLFS